MGASRDKKSVKVDLREFYSLAEVQESVKELRADKEFQKRLKQSGESMHELMFTTYPLKYLGIELHRGGGTPRFSLSTALRIALRPRSMDGASKGLHPSNHRKAFIERFPDVDAALSEKALFALGRQADLGDPAFFESAYAARATAALQTLEDYVGIPVHTSLQVLRKGLAAYRHGHRPGMSAHGWARARLASFTMKGCTHYFPDHTLVAQCPRRAHAFWSELE